MKTLVVTATFGDTKPAHPLCDQIGADVVRITRKEQFERYHDGFTERMNAKFIKWQMMTLYPTYDVYIWVDGQFAINSPHFAQDMIKQLGRKQAVFFKHPFWNDVQTEYAVTVKEQLDRYNPAGLARQMKLVDGNVSPLYATGCFAMTFTHQTSRLCADVWDALLRHTAKDQIAFAIYMQWLGFSNFATIEDNIYNFLKNYEKPPKRY